VRTPIDFGPGSKVGRFKIEKQLRSYSHTDVFLAREEDGSEVELEVTRTKVTPDFADQTGIAAIPSLEPHPNVVRVIATGWDEKTRAGWGAFDLSPGVTLPEVVRSSGTLEVRRALSIVWQTLAGLDALQRAGHVLAPSPKDVLVAPDGANDRVRLRLLDEEWAASYPGFTAQVVNPAPPAHHYVPPEVLNHGKLTPATSVYAAGGLLYLCVTGQAPFVGRDSDSVLEAVCREKPRAPSSLRPGVTPEVESAILEALEKDPALRPPDPRAFAARLRTVGGTDTWRKP
jgi:serine/threonine-protein kinase